MSWFRRSFQLLRTPGSFVQNAAFMFSASAGGILIQLLFLPLLSRIYTAEVYGQFGVFNAAVVILGVSSMLGYNHAFVLPRTERDFRALLSITVRSGGLFAGVATVLSVVALPFLLAHPQTADIGYWWLALGPLMALLVADRIMMDWSIREKAFKSQSYLGLPVTLAAKGFNYAYGRWISASVEGHILTTALNYVLRAGVYVWMVVPGTLSRLRVQSTREDRSAARLEYRRYPRFTMWANLLNTASNYIPVLVFPFLLDDIALAGHYTFALVVLDLPVRLLTSGISPVYINKAAELAADRPLELGPHTWRIYRNLLLLAGISMGLLYAVGQPAYMLVFGKEWSLAGQAAECLTAFYFFRLISSPIAPVINILRKEQETFRFQTILFVVRLLSLLIGSWFTRDFLALIIIFSLANGLTYLFLNAQIFQVMRYRLGRAMAVAVAAFVCSLLLAHGLKTWVHGPLMTWVLEHS